MRKVIVQAFVTLDGVVQSPGDPDEDRDGGFAHGGWVFPYFDEALGAAVDATIAEPTDLLLGRRTYDVFAGHWPRVADDDPMARHLNAATKYVATHRPDSLGWGPVVALGPDVAGAVAALRRGEGPNLVVHGSSDLVQTLLAAELVDELALFVFPLVIGSGKRLFGAGAIPAAYELVASRTSPAGVVTARYRAARLRPPGSFALPADP